jgi:2-methylisocitrate lyase-like PEP mutase family enzyme
MLLSVQELSAIGARRISVGSALYRAAMGAFLRAAHEMRNQGSFGSAADAASPRDIDKAFPRSEAG